MRSTLQIKGHPVHPILIVFPFGFLTAAVFFDLGAWALSRGNWSVTAYHMNVAGIVAGLAAGASGMVDYLFSVPPKSSAKKRATFHMIANVSALVLYTIALMFRGDDGSAGIQTILPELFGFALLNIGGWLGGTLVYRNQIGVDHRYAEAGKWKEESFTINGSEWLEVARSDELDISQMKLLKVGGRRVVLARTEEGYTAFDDHCTHKGGSLADGTLVCGTVQCPWHGSQFNAHTGDVVSGPAKEGIQCYEVEEREGAIYLRTLPLGGAQAQGKSAELHH